MPLTTSIDEPKWIRFVEQYTAGTTRKFSVENKQYDTTIGVIKWYPAFRKYSFFPATNCVFEADCLRDITIKLNQLNLVYKAQQQAKRQGCL